MADMQEYRERVCIIGKMIEKAFNGDKTEGESDVNFVLITSKVDDDNQRVASMLTNVANPHEVLATVLYAITQSGEQFKPISTDDYPVGHA